MAIGSEACNIQSMKPPLLDSHMLFHSLMPDPFEMHPLTDWWCSMAV